MWEISHNNLSRTTAGFSKNQCTQQPPNWELPHSFFDTAILPKVGPASNNHLCPLLATLIRHTIRINRTTMSPSSRDISIGFFEHSQHVRTQRIPNKDTIYKQASKVPSWSSPNWHTHTHGHRHPSTISIGILDICTLFFFPELTLHSQCASIPQANLISTCRDNMLHTENWSPSTNIFTKDLSCIKSRSNLQPILNCYSDLHCPLEHFNLSKLEMMTQKAKLFLAKHISQQKQISQLNGVRIGRSSWHCTVGVVTPSGIVKLSGSDWWDQWFVMWCFDWICDFQTGTFFWIVLHSICCGSAQALSVGGSGIVSWTVQSVRTMLLLFGGVPGQHSNGETRCLFSSVLLLPDSRVYVLFLSRIMEACIFFSNRSLLASLELPTRWFGGGRRDRGCDWGWDRGGDWERDHGGDRWRDRGCDWGRDHGGDWGRDHGVDRGRDHVTWKWSRVWWHARQVLRLLQNSSNLLSSVRAVTHAFCVHLFLNIIHVFIVFCEYFIFACASFVLSFKCMCFAILFVARLYLLFNIMFCFVTPSTCVLR